MDEALIWLPSYEPIVEMTGDTLFIDFFDYYINIGEPVKTKGIVLSSTETMYEFTSNFQFTLEHYEGFFYLAGSTELPSPEFTDPIISELEIVVLGVVLASVSGIFLYTKNKRK
jgi:hypothetical protein